MMIKKMMKITNTYRDDYSRCWSHLIDLYHGENLRHLPLTSPCIEQSGGCQEDPVNSSKC